MTQTPTTPPPGPPGTPPGRPPGPNVEGKVKPPAIALIVVGAIGLIFAIWQLIAAFAGGATARFEGMNLSPEQVEMMENLGEGGVIIGLIIHLIAQALIVLGGVKMMNFTSYGLAMTGSILAVIPCVTSSCCVLGIPFGIWALVVLMNADVKAAFGAGA